MLGGPAISDRFRCIPNRLICVQWPYPLPEGHVHQIRRSAHISPVNDHMIDHCA